MKYSAVGMICKALTWIVLLSSMKITTAKSDDCDSNAHIAIAIDSSKMTTMEEFAKQKEVVRKILDKVNVMKYALVIYTGDRARIHKAFGDDPSKTGATLSDLNYYQSQAYGFNYKALFSVNYKRAPDCLWILRNNNNYTYPKTRDLPDLPMGYNLRIPKIVLAFGRSFYLPIKNLTHIADLLFNGYYIKDITDNNLDDLKKSICKICKELGAFKRNISTTPTSTSYWTLSPSTAKTPDITKSTPVSSAVSYTPTGTVNPTSTQATWPSSTNVDPEQQFEKDYNRFLSYNTSQIDFTNEDETRKYITTSSTLLMRSNLLKGHDGSTNASIGYHVLDILEKFCISVGSTMSSQKTIKIQTNEMLIRISAVNMSSFQGFTFGGLADSDGFISLPSDLFKQHQGAGLGVVVLMIMDPIQMFIDGTTLNGKMNATLAGKVTNVITRPRPTKPLEHPVVIGFKHTKDMTQEAQSSCVFWDTQQSVWSTTGCGMTADSNDSVTECHCDHMTHYAVLLSLDDKVTAKAHYQAMTVITYIGCSLSITGVFLTIITFLCLPVLKSERTRIHCNLCFAIGLSQILFLAAGSKELVENTVACKLYAAVMFYCFMSVFTWMFVEGVHLYQMIIIAFVSRSMMRFYYSLGWGLPAVIVAIASAITYKGYGTDEFCWISLEGGTIYAFAVPAAIIILLNMAVLCFVLRLRVKMEKSSDVHKTVKTGARVSVVLLPLLGMTWVFGFFSILPHVGVVFQYLFAITNSLQGFMVFIFHCVGNSEVRREFHRKAEHWYLTRNLSSNTVTMVTNKVMPSSNNDSVDMQTIQK